MARGSNRQHRYALKAKKRRQRADRKLRRARAAAVMASYIIEALNRPSFSEVLFPIVYEFPIV